MSLRVLHVLDHSIPLQSGYTFRTCGIIREQRRLGWETIHLTSPKHRAPGPSEEVVEGLLFYRTAQPNGAFARVAMLREVMMMRATARRLRELVRKTMPDVLHVHSPVLNALPALWIGREMGIPVVYEVRAFWEDAAVDHGTNREWGLRYRLTRALETFALRRAQRVTTICEGLKRDILARGIPESRVTVIPNAVDVSAFSFDTAPDTALKHELGLDGCTVVGFIGSFYAYEGLDLLLAATPRIVERIPNARILLVGGGPDERTLRLLAEKYGVADKVIFAGRVPHGDVQRYYSIVDILTYPRRSMRLTELVTPLKPLEAMAQGKLFVASDVGGHKELIVDGHTGVLFRAGSASALADAVVGLLSDRGRWSQLREQGRRFVESERSWARSVALYRPVFEGLLAGTP
jgi:PEP-CTERM/exosortase A-associated glycosyltransferase